MGVSQTDNLKQKHVEAATSPQQLAASQKGAPQVSQNWQQAATDQVRNLEGSCLHESLSQSCLG